MKKVFKSKVDTLLILIVTFPLLFSLFFFINIGNVVLSVIIVVVAFLVGDIFSSTNYSIIENFLIIKSSFLVNKKLNIKSIKKIEKSKSWEKAPANSMDRIEIKYNEKRAVRYNFYDSLIISPEYKEEFIAALLEVNPTIEVDI